MYKNFVSVTTVVRVNISTRAVDSPYVAVHRTGKGALSNKESVLSVSAFSSFAVSALTFCPVRAIIFPLPADVAELADASDLKSDGTYLPYRFEPGHRYQTRALRGAGSCFSAIGILLRKFFYD